MRLAVVKSRPRSNERCRGIRYVGTRRCQNGQLSTERLTAERLLLQYLESMRTGGAKCRVVLAAVSFGLLVAACSGSDSGQQYDARPVTPPKLMERIELGQIRARNIVVDPKRQVLYVACTTSERFPCSNDGEGSRTGSVLVVDLATKKVTKAIALSAEAAGSIALDQQLNTLYVESAGGDVDVVDVVDLNTSTVGTPLSPGGTLAVNTSTHALFVARSGSSPITRVYDGATHNLIGSISTSSDSYSMAVDPANKRLYVGHGLGSSTAGVSVFDTVSNQKIADVLVKGGDGGGFVDDIEVDPKTQSVYVADSYYGRVQAIDGVAKTLSKTIEVQNVPQKLAIDSGWSLIYAVSNNGGTEDPMPVKVVDMGSGTLTTTIDTGHVADAVTVDPDKHAAYVLDHDDQAAGVSVIAAR